MGATSELQNNNSNTEMWRSTPFLSGGSCKFTFFFLLLLSPCQSQKHFVLIKIDKRAADKGNSGRPGNSSGATIRYRPNPAQPDDSRSAATLTPLHFRFGPVQLSSVHFSSFCFGAPLSLSPSPLLPSPSLDCVVCIFSIFHFGICFVLFLFHFRGLSNCKKSQGMQLLTELVILMSWLRNNCRTCRHYTERTNCIQFKIFLKRYLIFPYYFIYLYCLFKH